MDLRSAGMYKSALLKHKSKLREALEKRYPELMKLLDKYLGRNQCPFCKKRFKAKYALFKHLQASRCGAILQVLYRKIREKAPEKEILKVIT